MYRSTSADAALTAECNFLPPYRSPTHHGERLRVGLPCSITRHAGTGETSVPVTIAVSESVDSAQPMPMAEKPRCRTFSTAFASLSAVYLHAGHECSGRVRSLHSLLIATATGSLRLTGLPTYKKANSVLRVRWIWGYSPKHPTISISLALVVE